MNVSKGYCPPRAMRCYLASARRRRIVIIVCRHEPYYGVADQFSCLHYVLYESAGIILMRWITKECCRDRMATHIFVLKGIFRFVIFMVR